MGFRKKRQNESCTDRAHIAYLPALPMRRIADIHPVARTVRVRVLAPYRISEPGDERPDRCGGVDDAGAYRVHVSPKLMRHSRFRF
ncbi:hypothetical protein ACFQ9R_00400 [Nocardia sp. NPDC056541]|uniref:hypothetical protein n=1 Tax=unclassified Nocardia TaxID=2637762 RepID=UPI00366D50AB